jgi:hypothetical protein
MKRSNLLTTIGGILSLLGGIPIALGTAGVKMPSWLYIVCISGTVIGGGITGIAAKGQDEPAVPPAPPANPPPVPKP